LGDQRAATALMTILSDTDAAVRRAAAESLQLLGKS
jgi:HEAT repeat protein